MSSNTSGTDERVLNMQHEQWERTFASRPEMFGVEPSYPARKAAQLFEKERKRKVLELGCGQGRDTLFLVASGFDVTALDYSERGLQELRVKAEHGHFSSLVTTVRHDIRKRLPFDDGSFDACFSHMLYCMALTTTELEFLSGEIFRVLKPGGLNVYTVRNTNDPDYRTGMHRGEDMYELEGAFIVHFFNRERVERLARNYELLRVEEFDEGGLPKRLFLVTLKKADSIAKWKEWNMSDTCNSTGICEQVQELYTKLALHPENGFAWGKGKGNARALDYDEKWLEVLPAAVWESTAAVGNPFAIGSINVGETVLDLGCGAGADVCIAALLVGPHGRVIGVDFTPAMVEKARANSKLAGLANVTIHQADIADLPLPDDCVDIVISNGAINLSQRKPCVLGEAFRVLKPGGRLYIADMVRDVASSHCGTESSGNSWANCVAGALSPGCLLQMLSEAGFEEATFLATTGYRTSPETIGATFRAKKPTASAKSSASES